MNARQTLILKQEFADDLTKALCWYDSKQEGLSDRLYDDVFKTLSRIKASPLAFAVTTKDYRQALLEHFPYVIVFKLYPKEIVVYALFHTAKDPRGKVKRKR